jgi:hypothetical protein
METQWKLSINKKLYDYKKYMKIQRNYWVVKEHGVNIRRIGVGWGVE